MLEMYEFLKLKSPWISQFSNLHEFLNLKSSWLSQLKIFMKFSIENLHRVDLTCSTIFKFIQSTKTKIIQWFYKINSTKKFNTLSHTSPERTQPKKLCTANFSSGTFKTLIDRPLWLKKQFFLTTSCWEKALFLTTEG